MKQTQSVIPAHEVYESGAKFSFYCPAWHMAWRFPTRDAAAFCLSAHLSMPVAPCKGALRDSDSPSDVSALRSCAPSPARPTGPSTPSEPADLSVETRGVTER